MLSSSSSLASSHSLSLWHSAVFILFPSSHPLFISLSSSSLLLGSLLTLLNVRAQTSPCRAAPSHRGQKQLVSLPFPCFLAASVCLTVCLPASHCPIIPSSPHLLSVTGWSFSYGDISQRRGCSNDRSNLIDSSQPQWVKPNHLFGANLCHFVFIFPLRR